MVGGCLVGIAVPLRRGVAVCKLSLIYKVVYPVRTNMNQSSNNNKN